MSASMALAVHEISWELKDFACFRKCGEITVSPDAQSYGINCLFCPGVCLQFDVFVQHVREAHGERISALYEQTEELEMVTKVVDTVIAEGAGRSKHVQNNQKQSKTESDSNVDADVGPEIHVDTDTDVDVGTDIDAKMHADALDVEMELQSEAPQEVDLVYIMESDSPGAMEEEEAILDPFDMSAANLCMELNTEDKRSNSFNQEQLTEVEKDLTAESISSTFKLQNCEKPLMDENEHSTEVIFYLLEAYKKHEKLWNPNHPQYKYNANRKMFEELSRPLLRDMNYSLCGAEIYAIIKSLRSRYRRELTKTRERKGKYNTRFKYFDKMEFLRDVIENKRAARIAKKCFVISDNEKSLDDSLESLRSDQNRELLSYLLNAFRCREALWNPQHPEYLKCNKNALFHEISMQLLKDMKVSMTSDECFAQIQKLRTRYRKELRMAHEHKGLYVPKLWCFGQMEFLHNIFEDQLLERNKKRKGVVACKPKMQYLKAKSIAFETTDEHLTFVEIYKSYSALWDVDHPDYRSATYRNEELNQMLEEVNLMLGINSSLEELQKTLYILRKDFSAEKHKTLTEDLSSQTTTTSIIHNKLSEFLDMNLGPFRCDICNKIIKTSDQYKIHKSGHDGMQPFICTLCGKGFQIPGNLTIHIRRHKGDFPYACEVCDKKFATSTEVAIHIRSHTGERPYICDLCGKSFKTWSFYDVHRRTHLKQSNFLCPICDKAFYERNRYTDHMNGHLNIRKHICEVCGKSYTTFANLKKHTEVHLSVKKYKCDICGKRFAQSASVRWHKRRSHSDPSAISEQLEQ